MDTGKGNFEILEGSGKIIQEILKEMEALENKHPGHGGWFQLDEIVELKGSSFRVKRIKPTEIVLKLLPKE